MKHYDCTTWLFLALVVLCCRGALAEDRQVPPENPRWEQTAEFRDDARQSRQALRLAQLVFSEHEVIEPGEARPHDRVPSGQVLTLENLEQIALQHNPTLVQASMAVRAAQGAYLQAGIYPNPVIGYAGDDMGNDGLAGIQGGSVAQEIVTTGKLRLGRAVNGHAVQQARRAWEAQRGRVLNGVRAGYYAVLLMQKTIDINQQLVHISEESLKATQQLRAAQEVTRAELLQVRIEAETAKLALAEAQTFHRAEWWRLAAVLGRPRMEPVALAGDITRDLPVLDERDTRARLLYFSPELSRARAGVQRARCELALQQAERIPNFEVATAIKYDHSSEFAIADFSLGWPLPLFNRNQGNIVAARAELAAATREVQRVELALRERFATAFGDYVNARRQVKTYTDSILPNAKASLDLTTTGYREGEFGYLTLLTAQRTLFSVSLEYLANLKELWARTVELEGMLLEGALEPPD